MASQDFPQATVDKINAVNAWIVDSLIPSDLALDACLNSNAAAFIPAIDVASNEGKMLYLFAKMTKSKRVLEIGCLGGYSSIWFAKAVGPLGGEVITLEHNAHHAAIATNNIAIAGFSDVVEIKLGVALTTLRQMEQESVEAFDLVFIDADSKNNVGYLEYAIKLSKKGTLIVVDNVVMEGEVLDEEGDKGSSGVKELFAHLKDDKRVECTALQTVGPKQWDGFLVAMVV